MSVCSAPLAASSEKRVFYDPHYQPQQAAAPAASSSSPSPPQGRRACWYDDFSVSGHLHVVKPPQSRASMEASPVLSSAFDRPAESLSPGRKSPGYQRVLRQSSEKRFSTTAGDHPTKETIAALRSTQSFNSERSLKFLAADGSSTALQGNSD